MKAKIPLHKAAHFLIENNQYIKNFSCATSYNDEPKLYQYTIEFEKKVGQIHVYDYATGVSFNKHLALMRLFGETIERLSLIPPEDPDGIYESYQSLQQKGIAAFFPTHSKKIKNVPIHWALSFSAISKRKIYIPKQMVYLYGLDSVDTVLRERNSSGCALGSSFEDALYRGICELVERDSFLIGYLNKLPLPKIAVHTIKDKRIQYILQQLQRYNFDLHVLNATTDIGIPSVIALLIDNTGEGPSVTIGLKAGYNILDIIAGAIEEALLGRGEERDYFTYGSVKNQKLYPQAIETIEQRALYWYGKSMLKHLHFWIDSRTTCEISEFRHLPKKISSKDILQKALQDMQSISDILYTDVTTEDVKKFGFSVVRVIAPNLVNLYLSEKNKIPSIGKRIFTAPVGMGYAVKPSTTEKLHTIPHPFL